MKILVILGPSSHGEWDIKYPDNFRNDPIIQAWQRFDAKNSNYEIVGGACPDPIPAKDVDVVVEYEARKNIHNAGIDKMKCLKVFHVQDTVFYPDWHNFLAPKFDLVICAQRNAERLINHPNKVFIPSGFDPFKMYKIDIIPKLYDIGLITSPRDYDYRKSYLEKLPEDIKWNIWTKINPNEMGYALNQCYMGLNVSSTGTEDMLAYRICETLACGLLLITDRLKNNILEEFYEENVHYLGYEKENYEEFVEKVVWVKEHKEEAEEIRKKGYERVQEFTWDKHVEKIVEVIRRNVEN